jgi:hypothetical protein
LVPVEDSAAKWAAAFQVAGAGLGLHLVGHQDVLATLDQVFFLQAEVGITRGLIHDLLLKRYECGLLADTTIRQ